MGFVGANIQIMSDSFQVKIPEREREEDLLLHAPAVLATLMSLSALPLPLSHHQYGTAALQHGKLLQSALLRLRLRHNHISILSTEIHEGTLVNNVSSIIFGFDQPST